MKIDSELVINLAFAVFLVGAGFLLFSLGVAVLTRVL